MTINIKENQVNELVEKIKGSKTLMLVSVKGLPSKQFQDIKKAIREDAFVVMVKKNIVVRALNKFGKGSILPLENHINADIALVVSDKDGYELAGIMASKKTPAYAKTGQIAPEDIEVKAGPTDLVPGPAISELGAVGIQIAVEDGKIAIKADKVILDEGKEIKENVASLLQKLDIKPFTVGLNPLVIYDVESEKIYTDIKIDSEAAKLEIASSSGKALGFAQKIAYYCKETIGYFLGKANADVEVLGGLDKGEEDSEGEDKDGEEKVEREKNEEDKGGENSESSSSDGGGEDGNKTKEDEEDKKDQAELNNPEESA
ncbi:50S ribosomal protein L10 [Candidatus Pacearchaeota archaeon]|nr:50S ribosomal protein L10 [Candidatus Pacearchaeota archaeon]|tara:strand:- start:461 stop:1411 length:951 start_codon:yes stop_codon:yes gene_type:complete